MSVVQPSEADSKNVLACARKRAVAIILTPIVLTVIWAVIAMLTNVPVKSPSAPAPKVGAPVSAFSFPLLGGGTSSLSDYRGKLLLINIWATWCPPCINEMPDLQNLYTQMKSNGAPFEILGISIDALGAESVKKWVERFGIKFPILLDPKGTVKKLYQITGVPETFIVDPRGVLVRKFIGPLKWDGAAMIKFLNSILESRKKPTS